ncbi:MAG: hypothetical protein ACI4QE_05360, partial [Acutalibacteraceae bacterium]
MIQKAFDIVCEKVYKTLETQQFTRQTVSNADTNELVSLFTSESTAYSVVYYKDKKHMILRSCAMTDEGPDNEWRTLATWMFDPENDGNKEAESIGNDFADTLMAPSAIKRAKQARQKKKKSDDDGNATPEFLAKRFVGFFPELKDEIKAESDCYYPFRGATFARASLVPKINALLIEGDKRKVQKVVEMLSTQYNNGDIDTRSIITMVILNSIPEQCEEAVKEYMSED